MIKVLMTHYVLARDNNNELYYYANIFNKKQIQFNLEIS